MGIISGIGNALGFGPGMSSNGVMTKNDVDLINLGTNTATSRRGQNIQDEQTRQAQSAKANTDQYNAAMGEASARSGMMKGMLDNASVLMGTHQPEAISNAQKLLQEASGMRGDFSTSLDALRLHNPLLQGIYGSVAPNPNAAAPGQAPTTTIPWWQGQQNPLLDSIKTGAGILH